MDGLLRQLKGQGAGGVFCFTRMFACMLILRRWLLKGSDFLDSVPEDGLGAICHRVATVCKLIQNRETAEAVAAGSDHLHCGPIVKEKLSHSLTSW